MASITGLSEDVLYCIALDFERDRTTLYSLNLVCRAFHRITRALLFRHLGKVSPPKDQLLQRSLAENPDLKSHIHSCSITLNDGNLDENRLKKALALPNIRELSFSRFDRPDRSGDWMTNLKNALHRIHYGRSAERDFECGFLDACPLPGIRTICLQEDFTTTELIRFMLLPDVKVLKATHLDIMKEPRLSAAFATRTSALTTLHLLGNSLWCMEPNNLRSILSRCVSLRSLRCQVPMTTASDGACDRSSRVTDPVSPQEFNAVFEPVRHTLQQLSLLNLRHTVPYDGSHMDFSGFAALTDLEITSCCLLPPGAPCDDRDGLYRLLPASLQRLKIDFPRESGIFYHHEEGEAFLSQNPDDIPSSRYSWILQLLRHKATYMPYLIDVKMVDPPGSVGYWRWKTAKWKLPKEVAQSCGENSVELGIEFSYPQAGSNMDSWNAKWCKSRHELDAWQYHH